MKNKQVMFEALWNENEHGDLHFFSSYQPSNTWSLQLDTPIKLFLEVTCEKLKMHWVDWGIVISIFSKDLYLVSY